MTDSIANKLKAEFPRDIISWRVQTVYNGKALALAYIDARDVMQRLDEVMGIEGWEDSYIDSGKRTYCTLSLKMDERWVHKTDAAGDSDVEAEKGAVSDALKRAAVKWGIGRYLYEDRFKGVWVPCETQNKNGKEMFKKFTAEPWDYVKGNSTSKPIPKPEVEKPKPPESTPEQKEEARIKGSCESWLSKLAAAKLSKTQIAAKFQEFKNTENKKGENMWAMAAAYPNMQMWLTNEVDAIYRAEK